MRLNLNWLLCKRINMIWLFTVMKYNLKQYVNVSTSGTLISQNRISGILEITLNSFVNGNQYGPSWNDHHKSQTQPPIQTMDNTVLFVNVNQDMQ